LQDKNVIRKFVDILSPFDQKTILEIGPGTGSITAELYGKCKELSIIDIDERVIEPLKENYPKINVISGDILKLDFEKLNRGESFCVIGNIPFKITSSIIFKLIENIDLIDEAVFIIQNEVAKRITSKIGDKDYGILAVILGYISTVQYCFKISAGVFYPKPKVDSAAIHIKFNRTTDRDISHFIKIVKASFGNRRKTLKNSLSNSIFRGYDFSKITIDLSRRAETLSIAEFVELSNNLKPSLKNGK